VLNLRGPRDAAVFADGHEELQGQQINPHGADSSTRHAALVLA
jgi:hypothetical protein